MVCNTSTWCLFTGMFHFRTAFRIRTICCLVAERAVFYTIRNVLIWSWRDRVTWFWCLRLLSCCRRWLLVAVLLPVTDVHISAWSHSSGSLSSLYFGILEIMHPWTWNVDLSWSDRLWCCLFLLAVFGVLVLKWPCFALKSDFLSIEATCLLILGALLSHSTFTKPNQYDAAWLINILGTSVFIM